MGQGLLSWALELDWLHSNPDLPVTVGALGPHNLNRRQTKMNLQPRVEKAPTYISKLKVGIQVKSQEQQDVALLTL